MIIYTWLFVKTIQIATNYLEDSFAKRIHLIISGISSQTLTDKTKHCLYCKGRLLPYSKKTHQQIQKTLLVQHLNTYVSWHWKIWMVKVFSFQDERFSGLELIGYASKQYFWCKIFIWVIIHLHCVLEQRYGRFLILCVCVLFYFLFSLTGMYFY